MNDTLRHHVSGAIERGEAVAITERPADVVLPVGITWEMVEEARAKYGIAADMVPVAAAPGCTAWVAIGSIRRAAAAQYRDPGIDRVVRSQERFGTPDFSTVDADHPLHSLNRDE